MMSQDRCDVVMSNCVYITQVEFLQLTDCKSSLDSYTEKCRDICSWRRCLRAVKCPVSDLLSYGTVAEHHSTTQITQEFSSHTSKTEISQKKNTCS